MSHALNARVEKAVYLAHLGATEVTVTIPGEHRPERGTNVTLTTSEAKK